VVLHGENLTM